MKKKNIDLDEEAKSNQFVKFGKYPDPLTLDEKKYETLKKISEISMPLFRMF